MNLITCVEKPNETKSKETDSTIPQCHTIVLYRIHE